MHTNTSSPPTPTLDLEIAAGWAADARALLAGLDPITGVPDTVLMDLTIAVEQARHALDAITITTLGELHARGTTEIVDGLNTARWLADRTATSTRTARRRVRVADVVRRELPVTETTLHQPDRRTRFGFDHAAVLADAINPRNADDLRQMESELVVMAETMTFEAWRTRVRIIAAHLDADGAYDPDTDVLNNRLTLRPDPDGLVVRGSLVGDCAVTVTDTLDQITSELLAAYRADAAETGVEVPPMLTIRALALAEICHRALRGRPGAEPKTEATLVVHADDLDVVYDSNNIAHRREALGALVCDSELWTVILDSLGVPLDVGRAERVFTRAQRRALARRDGGCVFPGCNTPVHACQAHHVDWWTHGGATDVARGAMLCRHHHGVIHRTGWNLDLTEDQWAVITTPDERHLWGQRHHTRRTGPTPTPEPRLAPVASGP